MAAFCLDHGVSPRAVRNTPGLLTDFQARLAADGLELGWPDLTG